MAERFFTSRAFNQDTGSAKRAAAEGPVVITERGKPSHVLLTYATYRKLKGPDDKIADRLFMPGIAEIELDIPPRSDVARAVDLT